MCKAPRAQIKSKSDGDWPVGTGQVLLWRNYINSSQHLGITINCARSVGAEIPSYHFILSVLTKSK